VQAPSNEVQDSLIPGESAAERTARQWLDSLSLDEKVGQLFLIYNSPAEFMAEHNFGASLIMQNMLRKPEQLKKELARTQQLSRIPLMTTIDQEGGTVNRLKLLPKFKDVLSATELSTKSPDSIKSYLGPVAHTLHELGLNTNLAPVLDPTHNHKGETTLMHEKKRSFGRDSAEIVPPARAFVEAFHQENILCISKHFPGYVVAENSDHELAESDIDSAALEAFIAPFTGLADKADGVMMSSIRFTKFSEKPAVFDPEMVRRARDGNPDLLVMTDDLWGMALRAWVSGKETVHRVRYSYEDLRKLTLLAFDAGNDLLMITFPVKAVEMKEILLKEIPGNPEREKKLDRSVYRILLAKAHMGLLKP